ncbi:MAG: M23 family metallopeptidase [Acutalibacteraceae bacterium]|nr:M23 family metallopeptidase [Acutalibacteraceae bacterium]
MKFYKSKTAKFLSGKGFYLVLAVCMAAMSIAVYSVIDTVTPTEPKENSSIQESVPEKLESFDTNVDEKQEDIGQNSQMPEENEPVANEGVATFFMLPLNGQIIKHYDSEQLQYSETYKDLRLHTGTDIAPLVTNDVISAGDGAVISVEENTVYGNVITVDHGNTVTIKYCGLNDITHKTGDIVSAGDIIGTVGTVICECKDIEHIHIEVYKNGKPVNPEEFFDIE